MEGAYVVSGPGRRLPPHAARMWITAPMKAGIVRFYWMKATFIQ
jgi:hypothetical protein